MDLKTIWNQIEQMRRIISNTTPILSLLKAKEKDPGH